MNYHLPKYVTLLSQRISVELAPNLHVPGDADGADPEHMHRAYGTYEESPQAITLDESMGFERQRETFLHENLHAMLAVGQLDELIDGPQPGLAEHVVSALSPIMLDWLRANPRAVGYLQERRT